MQVVPGRNRIFFENAAQQNGKKDVGEGRATPMQATGFAENGRTSVPFAVLLLVAYARELLREEAR